MKRILIAILGVAALAACTKTEVVSISEGNTIKFDNAFVGNPTKAGLPTDGQVTTTNIKHFYVYASAGDAEEVFKKEKVYPLNGVWVYDNLKQWEPNKTYRFAAYTAYKIESGNAADYSITPVFNYTDHTLTINGYVSDDDNQYDLLMALSNQNLNGTDASANVPVDFTFKHALAMIKFTLKNGLGNNELAISEFKVQNINTTGDVTISTPADPAIAWANLSGNTTAFTCDGFSIPANATAESAEFVVIPQSITGEITVTFDVKVTTTNAGEITKTLTAKISNPNWVVGNRYNYVATITGTDMDVIEFNPPVVEDWGNYNDPGTDFNF